MSAVDLSKFKNLPDTAGMGIIDAMMAEHERILQEADRLEGMAVALMQEDAFELEAYLEVIAFIREYSDATHHQKEEDILFSYMTERLGAVAENLIKHGMLVEHDQGRMCVRELEAAAKAHAQEPSVESKLGIISWAMEYVHLIRRHVEKENGVVYPFAQRSLSEEELAMLDAKASAYVGQLE